MSVSGSPSWFRQERRQGRMGRVNETDAVAEKGFPRTVLLPAGPRPSRRTRNRRVASDGPNPNPNQELTMADVAFVVTTVAVFALVALVAKGVAKL
ncbi:hypothetical protein [Streptomyces clavuligerus]|uniref:hypothetical protein n=1 Tax=Streptomyces clavuligerus TaxID=1901 RepID=UPI0013C48DC6|nr:hypothetical protein [Streptomyces clavuligerus]QPM27249.1 hypothetical protein I3J19_03260 [Streptomyces clavuligerus]